jgi:RNA-directed DNA polymerase
VDRPWKLQYLGFSMYKNKGRVFIRLAPRSIKGVKDKIREITSRSKPVPMAVRIQRINAYLGGWLGYFALAETPSAFQKLEGWLRRRLRMCLWKQWKRVRTRYRELRALGLPDWVVHHSRMPAKDPGAWPMGQ